MVATIHSNPRNTTTTEVNETDPDHHNPNATNHNELLNDLLYKEGDKFAHSKDKSPNVSQGTCPPQ